MSVNQRTATVNTLLAVLKDRGVDYELNGETPISEVLTKADRDTTRDILITMFKKKQVAYREEFQDKVDDDAKLKSYVIGLVNNWIRKAPEFNNSTKYVIKNRGSRAGSGDEEVREMKKLLLQTEDEGAKAMIQKAIDAKLAAIKAAKHKDEQIDMDKIPAHLRELLGL